VTISPSRHDFTAELDLGRAEPVDIYWRVSMVETLGVLAHHGGLVVDRPELTVGVVQAVSRPVGVELALLARRPLDRRSASERQADIRAGRALVSPAPRHLLPAGDEGIDLRVAWLDRDGRPHWEYGSYVSSSGDTYEGSRGPSLETVLRLPPLYDHVSVVLAWPEIGFDESVVELTLPDRATVERETVSFWAAPLQVRRPPALLTHRVGDYPAEDVAVETGRIVARPRVLSRGFDAVVVMTRLTAVGDVLSLELVSVARGDRARTASALAFPPSFGATDDPDRLRALTPGASVAVLHDREAVWLQSIGGSCGGGEDAFRSKAEFILSRPATGVVTLLVSWPAARLSEVCVEIPLA
jgi:hypothetical protein